MIPKLNLGKVANLEPDWNGFIGKNIDSVINRLKEWPSTSPLLVIEDSLGYSGFRKVTMVNPDFRVIIVCETDSLNDIKNGRLAAKDAKWYVLDIFVSAIRHDEPDNPFN